MGALTGLLYGLLAVFLGGWYFGKWTGNFALLLLILATVTFFYWLAERLVFAPRRRAAVKTLDEQDLLRRERLEKQGITRGITQGDADIAQARENLLSQPWWLDWTAGLFPVILIVFLLRSFLFEPFKIPTGSMIPTLLVGDLILVNKFQYGVRLPVINKKIVDVEEPKRGDVMVFRYPKDPTVDYIKRVVGLPGDEVVFRDQRVSVNGVLAPLEQIPPPGFFDEDKRRFYPEYKEKLGDVEHLILLDPQRGRTYPGDDFPYRQNCNYSPEEVRCKVPPGNYFMMGDNRDDSEDSRYWGFVPDQNIVGRAFLVWMNFGNLKRIGTHIQ